MSRMFGARICSFVFNFLRKFLLSNFTAKTNTNQMYAIREIERNGSNHLHWTIFIFIEIFWIFVCFRSGAAAELLVFVKVHATSVVGFIKRSFSTEWHFEKMKRSFTSYFTENWIPIRTHLTSSTFKPFTIADPYHLSKRLKQYTEVILLASEHLIKLHRNIKQLQPFSTDFRWSEPKLK